MTTAPLVLEPGLALVQELVPVLEMELELELEPDHLRPQIIAL